MSLFKRLFRHELEELAVLKQRLQQRETIVTAEWARAKAATTEARQYRADTSETLARATAQEERANTLLSAAQSLIETVSSQITGFNARYENLSESTRTEIDALKAQAARSVAEIRTSFNDLIDARAKAEVGKWVFVGGGGGTLAAVQYCALCAQPAQRWRMVPDEGPVCEICCETHLTAPTQT